MQVGGGQALFRQGDVGDRAFFCISAGAEFGVQDGVKGSRFKGLSV
jgi:hypothetical protein